MMYRRGGKLREHGRRTNGGRVGAGEASASNPR